MKVSAIANFVGSALVAGFAAGGAVLLVPGTDWSDMTVWHAAGAAALGAAVNHVRTNPFPKE